METKASIIVMSHMSDIQEMMKFQNLTTSDKYEIEKRTGFVKYLVITLKGDLTKEIDPDKLYTIFSGLYDEMIKLENK